MIRRRTNLKAADNSGAKILICICIPGRSNRLVAGLGDVINVVVRGAATTGLIKDHQIARAVVVRMRQETRRPDGSYIRFDDNAVVILEKGQEPKGGRIFGPIAREIKELGYDKIASLAPEVL